MQLFACLGCQAGVRVMNGKGGGAIVNNGTELRVDGGHLLMSL